ncbi:tellurite resistance TerB family protein [Pseudomonas sp. NPDC090755]|uniref:tellurite resistance TerB family protein n=1 Tax=Pseudomonas sp. NPDC090755 TaxID=3364481 RepID=UPI00383B7BCD
MFGLKKLLGKHTGNAQAEMKKVVNRDLMQAIVGGGLLIAAADGEIEASEVAKLDELIRANPNLSHFGSEITETINRFTAQLNANFQVGRLAIKRELADVKNSQADAEEAFVNIIAVAQADGEIEAGEMVVLKEVALHFGLRPQDYGIEV